MTQGRAVTNLIVGRDELNHLLQSASAVLVECNRDHSRGCIAHKSVALLIIAEFQELLTKVVTKRISHKLNHVRSGLVEDDLDVLWVTVFKLLLQETTTVLILAQAVNLVTRHGLQVIVHEAIGVVLQAATLNNTGLAILHATTWAIGSVWIVVVHIAIHGTGIRTVAGWHTLRTRSRSKREAVHSAIEHRHSVTEIRCIRR